MKEQRNYELMPDKIVEELTKRELALQQLLIQCRSSVKNAPVGKLRINITENRVQYFHRTDGKDRIGKYISGEDISLAYQLAQKDYNEKLVKEIEKELDLIIKMKKQYHPENLVNILETMHKERQRLIRNYLQSNQEYAEQWINKPYKKLAFGEKDETEFYTVKGERVRSKSEVIIANTLCHYKIPYRYESPIYLKENSKAVYPDFTCLNVCKRKEVLWEHLGMMGMEEYANKNVKKIEQYTLNGYHQGDNLIMTMETPSVPLNTRTIEKMIKKYLL